MSERTPVFSRVWTSARLGLACTENGVLWRCLPAMIFVSVTFLLHPTLDGIRLIWVDLDDAGYEHGPLLAAVTLGLLVQTTPREFRPNAPRSFVIWPLAVCSVVWACAVATSTLSASLALWPVVSWLALAAAYGPSRALHFVLPLSLLYFSLPVWGPLTNFVLWPLTVFVASNAVELLGINAFMDGNTVVIPSGSFEIISGCSGQQFFLVACVIALLIGHLNSLRFKHFSFLVLIAIGVALVSNWLRVIAIIVIGYATEMRHPLVADGHLVFGWGLFAFAILIFCVWARRYLARLPDSAFADKRPASVAVEPSWPATNKAALAAMTVTALLIGPVWVGIANRAAASVARDSARFSMPTELATLVGPFSSTSPLTPRFLNPDVEKSVAYSFAGGTEPVNVFVYANLYHRQTQGSELVGYGTELFPGANWKNVRAAADEPSQRSAWTSRQSTVVATDVSGRQWVVRHTYAFDQRTLANPLATKLLTGFRMLALQSPKAGAVMVAVQCNSDCGAALALLDSAWLQLLPPLVSNYGG